MGQGLPVDGIGSVGRPWSPLRGASPEANQVAQLMRDLIGRSGLNLRQLVGRLPPAAFSGNTVPSPTTLSRRLRGEGLSANHGPLVTAVIELCAPSDEAAVLLERAGELLARMRARDLSARGNAQPSELLGEADQIVPQIQEQLARERELRYRSEATVTLLLGLLAGRAHPVPGTSAGSDSDRLASLEVQIDGLREEIARLTVKPEDAPPRAVEAEEPVQNLRGASQPGSASVGLDADEELVQVAEFLRQQDPDGSRMATLIREAFDDVIDGPRTGRYSMEQLLKTEKVLVGTQVQRAFQRAFGLTDGSQLDLSIAGIEVEFLFTQHRGSWAIPREAVGHIVLLVYGREDQARWGAGLCRVTSDLLNGRSNRDGKQALRRDLLESGVCWLFKDAPLRTSILLQMDTDDVQAVFNQTTSARRVDELARRANGRIISRSTLATVVMQRDAAKRLRDARSRLAAEGLFILVGSNPEDRTRAEHLGLPSLAHDELVIPALVRVDPHQAQAPHVELSGEHWSLKEPLIRAQ